MTGIFYFSGTGNSLYIAQQIQSKLGGKVLFVPNYNGDGSEFDRIIIVSPIYSFGLPIHIYNLFPKLNKETVVDVVLNYGGFMAGTNYFTYKYCKSLGLNLRSVYTLKMPENYTLTFTVPEFYLKSTLKKAPKQIDKIIASLEKCESKIPRKTKTLEKIYLENKDNWYKIGQDFHTTENCINCGKCIEICPSGNISLSDGKITFSDKCVACLGCYHRCPQKAIQYKDKIKKFRYVNPNVKESDIGKDL